MTLADLLESPLPDQETLRSLALVFDQAFAQRVANVQAWFGNPMHQPRPAALDDGRWAFSAEVLMGCSPGGILWEGFSKLNADRFDEILVVPAGEITLADPQPPPIGPEPNPAEVGQ